MTSVSTAQSKQAVSPVRIYLLWHPDFKDGLRLARRIYYWFRLETGEGIPVYFRCEKATGGVDPPPIPTDCGINYLIPLVEENMVACPHWRHLVAKLVRSSQGSARGPSNRIFPVALDPVSYQMPPDLRRLNFIRHIRQGDAPLDDEVLLGRLTEVLCRDLRDVLAQHRNGSGARHSTGKLKIFLSHAKADGTDTPIRLKEYIQGQTQCDAFFDENDIPSGSAYADVLDKAIREDSAGLIVVQGDHYSDRPWCRKEVRDFLTPQPAHDASRTAHSAYFTPPAVVVLDMVGEKLAHAIPELGYAPCLRWSEGSERRIVTTLIREVLFGLFYRELARQLVEPAAQGASRDAPAAKSAITIYLNRRPDPVLVQRVIADVGSPSECLERFVYPGYGLSQMDRAGLKAAFPEIEFTSFYELSNGSARFAYSVGRLGADPPVLAVSVGNATDILASGAGDEHNRELLMRLLRPLFRAQFSVLYGGSPPRVKPEKPRWEEPVNFTEVFVYLLLSERDENDDRTNAKNRAKQRTRPRLYNLSAFPHSDAVDTRTVAQWTNVCSFVLISQDEAGIPKKHQCEAKDRNDPSSPWRVNQALCLTAMRKRAVTSLSCKLPDGGGKTSNIETKAHIFIGGKIASASGIMPGMFEEILYALEMHKAVYLIGAGKGAAGLVARWLIERPARCPRELTPEHYDDEDFDSLQTALTALRGSSAKTRRPGTAGSPAEWESIETTESAMARLWGKIQNVRSDKDLVSLFRNGLTAEQNRRLLTSGNYAEIVALVHTGMAGLLG